MVFAPNDLDLFLADLGEDVVFGATTVKGLLDRGPGSMTDPSGLSVELEPETVLIKTGALQAKLAAPGAPGASVVPLTGAVDAGTHRYKVTFVTALGETEGGAESHVVTTTGFAGQVSVDSIAIGPTGTTARKLYRTAAGGSTFKLLATIADNVTVGYFDNNADSALGATCPTTNASGMGEGSTITVGGTSYRVREARPEPIDGAFTRLILVR